MLNDSQRKAQLGAAVLLAGDLVCFLVFALTGLRSHEDGITPASVLRAAVPFQAGWLVFSLIFGLQGRPGRRPRWHTTRMVIAAWLPAWLLGLALRTLIFGRAFAPAFAVVALIVNAALLLAWRLAAGLRRSDERD